MADATATKQVTLEELLSDMPRNWGRWGDDDEIGCLNFLTSKEVLRGVRRSAKARCSRSDSRWAARWGIPSSLSGQGAPRRPG